MKRRALLIATITRCLSFALLLLLPISHAQTDRPWGTLVSWGTQFLPYVEPGTRFTAVAAGGLHNLALKDDGSVLAWGQGGLDEAPIGAKSGVLAIAAGYGYALALRTNGSVVAWGGNFYGQTTVPSVAQSGVAAIAAGRFHSLALKTNGSVVAWGMTNVPVAAQSGVVAIAAGGHALALKSDGSVVAWGGDNSFGQIDTPPEAQSGVVAIACGSYHSVALKSDGSIVTWGANHLGQTIVPVEARSAVMAIAAGGDLTIALKVDGSVVWWGGWHEGAGTVAISMFPNFTEMRGVVAVASGNEYYSHTVILKTNGAVVAWGSNSTGQTDVPAAAQSGIAAIAAGSWLLPGPNFTTGGHTLALRSDGSVLAWGDNSFGQIDVPPEAQSGIVAIAAGDRHSVALRNDGSVLAWGDNGAGETDVPVTAQSEVVAIAAGGVRGTPDLGPPAGHTVALKADGSVVAWRDNSWGQTQVPVEARSGVMAIAAGSYHTVALKTNGSVIAWGNNGEGQTTVPTTAKSGVVAIAAGDTHSVALKTDGSVVAWGSNGATPVKLPPAIAIAAGGNSTFALVRDPPASLSIVRNADQTLGLSWRGAGALEQTESLTAPNWQPSPAQANPQTLSTTGVMEFYRVKAD